MVKAAFLAGAAGGIPSTLFALATGADRLSAINAIAAMAGAENLALVPRLVVAAAIHLTISIMWSWVLFALLPRRHTILWAAAGGGLIAGLDLLLLAPLLFAEIAALPLGPQVADHLVWGLVVGWARRE